MTDLPVGTIEFSDVSKTYHIIQRASPRFGAWVLNKMFEHFTRSEFSALRNVSLHIEPGEMVGLLGPNGAGKSTVLKLIAGITQPTSGTVRVSGPVTSMLELGVGFHPDLTGMENIFYNGAMMGLKREIILERLDQIIDFSGLREFLYEPVKHYSSGMYSRLACGVALHLDPKIILVDEILAVGDAEFQQRSVLKILELHEQGVTILLVTHETATARDTCNRLIWIDEGTIREEGNPLRVHHHYMASMNAKARSQLAHSKSLASPDSGSARVASVSVIRDGEESTELRTHAPVQIQVAIEGTVAAARLELRWYREDGRLLAEDLSPPVELEGERAEFRFDIPWWPLINSGASLEVSVMDVAGASALHHHSPIAVTTEQSDRSIQDTLMHPKATWSLRSL